MMKYRGDLGGRILDHFAGKNWEVKTCLCNCGAIATEYVALNNPTQFIR